MEDNVIWSRQFQLSKAEQKRRQQVFSNAQAQYNQSGDKKILWEVMYPLIIDAVKSNVLKINCFHFVVDFDEKVDNAVTTIMNRYVKNKEYNFGSLVTLAYWAAVYECRKTGRKEKDLEKSYEVLVDEMKLHEEEHIIDFDNSTSSCKTKIGDEEYFIEDLY